MSKTYAQTTNWLTMADFTDWVQIINSKKSVENELFNKRSSQT